MITHGQKEWIAMFKDLWKEGFLEEGEEIDYFFQYIFRENLTWCYVKMGVPVSVIYGIPVFIWQNKKGDKEQAVYLYAGATKYACRNNGYYGKIIEHIEKKKNILGTKILVPANGLTKYYEKLGFCKLLEEEEIVYDTEQIGVEVAEEPITVYTETVSPKHYKELRDYWMGESGYIEWPESYLAYALYLFRKKEGLIKAVKVGEEQHILLGEVKGDCLVVEESTMSKEQLGALFRYLPELAGCRYMKWKGYRLMGTRREWEAVPYFRIGLDE